VATPGIGTEAPAAVAARLAPRIRELAGDIEEAGCLPGELVEPMTGAGLFELYRPSDTGGLEADPLTAFEVTETLARADGSVAWCVSVSTALSNYLGWLSPDGLAEVTAGVGRLRLAGSARPLGRATPVEGGYSVHGHWDFASNVLQAGWYVGTCVIEGDHNRAGEPKARSVFLAVPEGRVERTWSVLGMRGTGSHDFVVEDVFVPARRVASIRHARSRAGRLYHPRLAMVVTWAPTAGVALGLARGALDDFAELSSTRSTASPVPLAHRREVQAAVGQAEAIVAAARAYCVDAIAGAWEAVASGEGVELVSAIAHARRAITHAMGEGVRAVDVLLRAAGTGGVFCRAGIERRFRDVHVAQQHAAGLPGHVEAAGRVLLGLPADAPYF
jgi:alkylation response protein AidB-like acyl-CoA dehydrogenase